MASSEALTETRLASRLPRDLGSKEMRFMRRCNGIVSRTSICLTMKAR